MTIQELRAKTGLSQLKFAEYFGLPIRTVQEWEQGRRKPPDYIPKLLEQILRLERQKCIRCSPEMICKNGCSSSGNCTYPKCSFYEK